MPTPHQKARIEALRVAYHVLSAAANDVMLQVRNSEDEKQELRVHKHLDDLAQGMFNRWQDALERAGRRG